MTRQKRAPRSARLGKQEPRYRFFLNPYSDERFTTCPQCRNKTRVRKVPLVIHIDPRLLLALNKTCRFCPLCDLLIVHQDVLETWLAEFLNEYRPELVGNDYLVVGTEDRADWRRGLTTPLSGQEVFDCLHDFVKVVRFDQAPRWEPA